MVSLFFLVFWVWGCVRERERERESEDAYVRRDQHSRVSQLPFSSTDRLERELQRCCLEIFHL